MKLLLDECLPHDLRRHLPGHQPFTVGYMGWSCVKNGRLLALAAQEQFDVIITTDAGMAHQYDPRTLPLSIVILHAPSNALEDLLPLVPRLLALIGNAISSVVIDVD